MRTVSALGFLVASTFVVTQPAYAYLDPGTGSLLLQGIVGAIAASVTVVSLYYNRIKLSLSRLMKGSQPDSSN